jgi:hypothetical protein
MIALTQYTDLWWRRMLAPVIWPAGGQSGGACDVTKRQAMQALVAGVLPWHLGWDTPPHPPGPYLIVLDDVSEFVLARRGTQVRVPVDAVLAALRES